MIILSAVLSAVSGAGCLCAVSEFLAIISGERTTGKRLIISAFASAIIEFFLELQLQGFFKEFKFTFTIISIIYLPFLVWYSRKRFRWFEILMSLTVFEFFELTSSLIRSFLPESFRETRVAYIGCTVVIVALTLTVVAIYRNRLDARYACGIFFDIIPKRIYAFAFLSMFFESGITTVISYDVSNISENKEAINRFFFLSRILILLMTIINAVILITLIINVIYKKYYGDLNEMLKHQINSQLMHYEKREKLNTEIRSFRHDFNNHIKCLEAMMKSGKYEEAETYLQSLSGMMPSGDFLFGTGNYIADAILTEAQETNKNVTVKFQGFIPQNIDSVDLCTVLSNAVNNAAEACCNLESGGYITVYGDYRQGVFVLIVKNSTCLTGYGKDIFPDSSKSDKALHGFGLSNIRSIVKKYNGTVHTLLDNGCFTLSLTMSVVDQAES